VATDPGQPPGEQPAAGALQAAISNAAVRIHRDFLGRGPDRARTTIAENVVLVLLQDTLTRAERTLVAAGKEEGVRRLRQMLQHTIRDELSAAVEQITGRTVIAFMSANHIDPDLACEVIILAPEPAASGQRDPSEAGP
jgi:uncharacterized protein YbcI